jgi:uncharacterized CHY-type Zn-finger protein
MEIIELNEKSPYIGSIDQFRYFSANNSKRIKETTDNHPSPGIISNFETKLGTEETRDPLVGRSLKLILSDQLFDFSSDQENDALIIRSNSEKIYQQGIFKEVRFLNKHKKHTQIDKIINLKSIVDLGDNKAILQAKRFAREYCCKYCGEPFNNGCSLGGHISKVHKNKNTKYLKKESTLKVCKIEDQRDKLLQNIIDDLKKKESNGVKFIFK